LGWGGVQVRAGSRRPLLGVMQYALRREGQDDTGEVGRETYRKYDLDACNAMANARSKRPILVVCRRHGCDDEDVAN